MCLYSRFWVEWEKKNLAPYATHGSHPWYSQRGIKEQKDHTIDRFGTRSRYRTSFEIDKDRITNSQAFRRLEYKTQVFVTHEGDHYRTRLTHSLEVSEIARHIARALRLNENLVEAIALGHDLGHAPYGHIAENAINDWIASNEEGVIIDDYYFCHNRHSVEIVDHLEPGYDWDARKTDEGFARGLNLTNAVREGLLVHINNGYRGMVHQQIRFGTKHDRAMRRLSKANIRNGLFYPGTLEAQAVRISDDLAQRIHDLEDGFRSGLIKKGHINDMLLNYIDKIKDRILVDEEISEEKHLQHKVHKTKISKAFIADIISLLELDLNSQDKIKHKKYSETSDQDIKTINDNLSNNKGYRELFLFAVIVSFLLHMWRDDQYLDLLSEEDQRMSKTRILKYLRLLLAITGKHKKDTPSPPTYHIIAFLRGVMLANVIEHSFWRIQSLLDVDFRKFHRDSNPSELIKTITNIRQETEKFYVAFSIVDGFISKNEGRIQYIKRDGDKNIFCFEFTNEVRLNEFLRKECKEIIASNGCLLHSKYYSKNFKESAPGYKFIKKISWLNKSEEPIATELVKLTFLNNTDKWVPIESIKIYFTGYKELCPGSNSCKYANQIPKKCDEFEDCDFKDKKVKYPDINRIIKFQEHMEDLDNELKLLIKDRLHNRSRIARMNYMGEKIIKYLLELYYSNPRVMHDRVWDKLRVYKKKEGVSPQIKTWIDLSQMDKDQVTFNQQLLNILRDVSDNAYENNRISLARRIIEHVAGMTDRFIANEYNRLNQSGREVETQDETYLFK